MLQLQDKRFLILFILLIVIAFKAASFLALFRLFNKENNVAESRWETNMLGHDMEFKFAANQDGEYLILQNYVIADDTFPLNASVTYTTHGTFKDLHLLENLLAYWQSPVSIALFANGNDFAETLKTIFYYRHCSPHSRLIRYFVTFHLCIHRDFMPDVIPQLTHIDDFQTNFNCSDDFIVQMSTRRGKSFWRRHQLQYPRNLLRNIARRAALTYYVVPLDLNFVPKLNFSRNFLDVVSGLKLATPERSVFCFPITRGMRHPMSYIDMLQYNGTYKMLSDIGIERIEDDENICPEKDYATVIIGKEGPLYDQWISPECEASQNKTVVYTWNMFYNTFIILNGTDVGSMGKMEYTKQIANNELDVQHCLYQSERSRKLANILYTL